MRTAVLQDWITIQGVSATSAIAQSRLDWLDLGPYADAIFWIEVAEITDPGGGVTISFETAPVALDALFVAIDTLTVTAATTAPVIRKVFMNQTMGTPLARFLRWSLSAPSGSGTFDLTFRIHVSLGEGLRDAFSPIALPGLVLWLRADLGVVTSGANVTDWKDQSGKGNHVTQSVSGSRPRLNATIGGRPAIDFSTNKFLENTVSNLVTTAGNAYSVLLVAQNGSGSFLSLRRTPAYSASMFFLSTTYVWSDSNLNETVPNTLGTTQSAAAAFKSCHRYRGPGQKAQVYLNGQSLTVSGSNQTAETGTTGFQVGTNSQGVPEPWGGLIAELIVTDNAISDDDRERVEQYQREFFGI